MKNYDRLESFEEPCNRRETEEVFLRGQVVRCVLQPGIGHGIRRITSPIVHLSILVAATSREKLTDGINAWDAKKPPFSETNNGESGNKHEQTMKFVSYCPSSQPYSN